MRLSSRYHHRKDGLVSEYPLTHGDRPGRRRGRWRGRASARPVTRVPARAPAPAPAPAPAGQRLPTCRTRAALIPPSTEPPPVNLSGAATGGIAEPRPGLKRPRRIRRADAPPESTP